MSGNIDPRPKIDPTAETVNDGAFDREIRFDFGGYHVVAILKVHTKIQTYMYEVWLNDKFVDYVDVNRNWDIGVKEYKILAKVRYDIAGDVINRISALRDIEYKINAIQDILTSGFGSEFMEFSNAEIERIRKRNRQSKQNESGS